MISSDNQPDFYIECNRRMSSYLCFWHQISITNRWKCLRDEDQRWHTYESGLHNKWTAHSMGGKLIVWNRFAGERLQSSNLCRETFLVAALQTQFYSVSAVTRRLLAMLVSRHEHDGLLCLRISPKLFITKGKWFSVMWQDLAHASFLVQIIQLLSVVCNFKSYSTLKTRH